MNELSSSRLLRCAMLAGAALIGGCASFAPVPREAAALPALPMPDAWSVSAATADAPTSLATWWRRFDDPLLGELIEQALRANTSIHVAQASLRQARASRDQTAAGQLPALDASASAQRNRSGNASASNRVGLGLDASWEADLFGARSSAIDGRDASIRARTASLGDAQVTVAAEVALNLIDLRDAQARLAIADDNAASQSETLQLTQWRLQAGLVTALEVDQARAALEQTRAQRPSLETGAARAAFALSVLTGQPPAALRGLLATSSVLPQAPADIALALPADTLRQRPDVRAAEAEVAAAQASVAQADAARKPSLRLSGSIGLNALGLGGLGSGAALAAGLLAGLSAPLFDGGAGVAQVRVQQAALDAATASYRAALLGALQEVENALVALRGDRERLARLQQSAEAAASAARLAQQRYSSGLIDFQIVLQTQRTLLDTQSTVAAARAEISRDHVRLYKALGGGWSSDAVDSASFTTGRVR